MVIRRKEGTERRRGESEAPGWNGDLYQIRKVWWGARMNSLTCIKEYDDGITQFQQAFLQHICNGEYPVPTHPKYTMYSSFNSEFIKKNQMDTEGMVSLYHTANINRILKRGDN